jgi:hypothetical protein
MDRGATTIRLSVENMDGGLATADVVFQKEVIQKEKATIKFGP